MDLKDSMLPIIASLLQLGLPLIGNAIAAKGKEVIEEKLGVNIENMLGTEEGRVKLKQLEYANEESLRKFSLDKREQELKEDQMYLTDVEDSRKMQGAALGQEDVFSKRFLYYFSIGWSLVTAVYIGFITFANIPTPNVRFADTILGFLLGTVLGGMFNFFYGTSKGSQNKDEVIRIAMEAKNVSSK